MTDSHATGSRAAKPCNCWQMTPWGTWERLTSAPCICALAPAQVIQTPTTSVIQPGCSVWIPNG